MGFDKRDTATEYAPADGDNLKTIATAETGKDNPMSWQDISRFNWGTDNPRIVEEYMRDEMGCYKRGPDKTFVFSADCEVRTPLLVPKVFKKPGLSTTQVHTLTVHKTPPPPHQFEACCRIEGVTFEFDSSFIRPSVVDDLKKVEAELTQHPDAKVMIFGHTDKVGTEQYNKGLSERRAKSTYAFITNQPDIWEELYNQEHWGTKAIQTILKDLGGPYDPGEVDGIYGPKTRQAVKNFQGDHGLTVDGVAGPLTRHELFLAYMDGKHDIEVDDSRFMDPKHMGCGEFNPQVDTEEPNEDNRRVTVYLFNDGRLPNLPCQEGDLAPCQRQMSGGGPHYKEEFKCSFYDSIARECACEGGGAAVGAFGVTNLTLPSHIASGKETIKIKYTINDPGAKITSASITLKRKEDGALIWNRPLTATEWTNGQHELDWDGKIDAHKDFPDAYVTIEFSPYEMEIKVSGSGTASPASQNAEIKVEVGDLLVELAPKDHLTKDQDKAVHDQVKKLPATGTVELKLSSDLYATKSSEMNDNTAFTEYKKLWDFGPRIPMIATVTVLDSTGKKVISGKAMGNARLLWDYSDEPSTETDFLSTKAAAFLSSANTYDTTSLQPTGGDNCHIDRGGKRTDFATRPFRQADASVSNFPFKVQGHTKRPWAGFSPFEKSGSNEGKAGVIFRPSRTAGDNYKVHAYLGEAVKIGTKDEPPKDFLIDLGIGTFEVWREIHLVEHHRKCSAITAPVPSITDYYKDAYIRVQNDMGAAQTMAKADYNKRFADARAAVPNANVATLVRKYALPDGVSQYDTPAPPSGSGGGIKGLLGKLTKKGIDWSKLTPQETTWVMTVRPYSDFKDEVKKKEKLNTTKLNTALTNAGVETEVKYANATTYYAADIATEMCKALSKKDGVTMLQFEWTTSIEQAVRPGRLNGNACFKGRTNTGFALYKPAQDTTGHEIGHCMFMPHAPRPGVSKKKAKAEGIQPDRHDGKDMNCLMSYNRPRPGFCGLCILRLRGWDATQFDKNGAKTNKP